MPMLIAMMTNTMMITGVMPLNYVRRAYFTHCLILFKTLFRI